MALIMLLLNTSFLISQCFEFSAQRNILLGQKLRIDSFLHRHERLSFTDLKTHRHYHYSYAHEGFTYSAFFY